MEQTQPTNPGTERQRPGRLLATIVRVTTRPKGYIFARLLESAEECFIHKSTTRPELWEQLERGDGISCKVSETSKGLRGYDVVVSDDEEFRRYQQSRRPVP